MHGNHLSGTGFRAFAYDQFFDDKPAGRGGLTHCLAPECLLNDASIMP
jgi:hypothetical protein